MRNKNKPKEKRTIPYAEENLLLSFIVLLYSAIPASETSSHVVRKVGDTAVCGIAVALTSVHRRHAHLHSNCSDSARGTAGTS